MALSISDPVSAALSLGSSLIDRLWPNPADAAAAKLKLLEIQQNGELAELTAQSNIVLAEAKSESWLARNWRPMTMVVFVGLIVARWFGFTAQNLQPTEYLELWTIVKIGLGGYVIGRSAEKIAPTVATAITNANK